MMKSKLYAVAVLMVTLAHYTVVRASDHPLCKDIELVDIANATLVLGGDGSITFRSGDACPISIDDGAVECRLRYKIESDKTLKMIDGERVRILKISRDVLSGSGYSEFLHAYICGEWGVLRIYSYEYDGGFNIAQNTQGQLVIGSPVWKQNDPHCCPTLHRTQTLGWDSKTRTFTKVADEVEERRGR